MHRSFIGARKLVALFGAASFVVVARATPPVAPVRPVTDTYFGTTLTDPYRYMEDLGNSEVQAWAKAQAEATRAVLDSIP
jgi:prolyl oligopeptidase